MVDWDETDETHETPKRQGRFPAPYFLPVGTGHIHVHTSKAMPWDDDWLPETDETMGAWGTIDNYLRGDKPNRWIQLNDAVRVVWDRLGVEMVVARDWLLKEATPATVPWVGVRFVMSTGDSCPPWPMEITSHDRDVNFGARIVATPDGKFQEPYIELNHLEVQIEKYKAGTAPPVPSAPASTTPKNKGGAPRKFDKEAFMLQAARLLAQPDGIRPKTRQQLAAAMGEWYLDTWWEDLGKSTLRAWISEIYTAPDD